MNSKVINFDIVKEFIIRDNRIKEMDFTDEMSIFIFDVYYRFTIMGIPIGYDTKREVVYKSHNFLHRVIDGSGVTRNTSDPVGDKIVAYRILKMIKDKLHKSEFNGTDIEKLL